MPELLQHPAIQGGLAPFAAALVVAAILVRTKFAGLAILAAYVCVVALTVGFGFSPLTVSRKILALGLAAPAVGIVADMVSRDGRRLSIAIAVAAGIAALWVFVPVLQQKDAGSAWLMAIGLALFVAAMVALMAALRDDGLRAGAAGLGVGVAVGVAALLSASTGYLLNGIALAAALGALLVVQFAAGRNVAVGFTGALPIGLLAALFAAATHVLAALPWYALPLLLLIPFAALIPLGSRLAFRARAVVLCVVCLAAAAPAILAAWHATRG
ncbi:MAG: hypothetical protein MUF79_07235 [Burkholderiales bacterium]|jgi:hypothetical protein|nr:hypothetical protein [Burkholderiales bacterium]